MSKWKVRPGDWAIQSDEFYVTTIKNQIGAKKAGQKFILVSSAGYQRFLRGPEVCQTIVGSPEEDEARDQLVVRILLGEEL